MSAARSSSPNSANSQFFICFADAPGSTGNIHSVWGQVVEGMEHIDAIKNGGGDNGAISGGPDKIVRMRIEADS